MKESFQRALKGNVKIAFGTDSGVSRHGENAREFQLMVDYGMDPSEAIKAATVNAADLLGKSEELGTVEPGKSADIIAVRGDPIENIEVLMNVPFVMKAGVVYKNE